MNDVRTLTTLELQQGLDRDSGLHLLNVQTDQFFTGELIPGSRRVSLDTIAPGAPDLPKDASIVTYCAGPSCSQSLEAAHKLAELGYTNVRTYLRRFSNALSSSQLQRVASCQSPPNSGRW